MINQLKRVFSGAQKANLDASEGAWPKATIVEALKARFDDVSHLQDEQGFALYGVTDGRLNFVAALVEAFGAPDHVVEVGFLARFVGFPVDDSTIDFINRNLNLAISGRDEQGALFLIAGVQAAGTFDAAAFSMILEAWNRDLQMAVHALSGGASIAAAFPAMASERALAFAANAAPAPASDGRTPDVFSAFFDKSPRQALCPSCEGRGRRGFIAQICEQCDGKGLIVAEHRRS